FSKKYHLMVPKKFAHLQGALSNFVSPICCQENTGTKGGMPSPGFEPGFLRPQRNVLTTRLRRPSAWLQLFDLNREFSGPPMFHGFRKSGGRCFRIALTRSPTTAPDDKKSENSVRGFRHTKLYATDSFVIDGRNFSPTWWGKRWNQVKMRLNPKKPEHTRFSLSQRSIRLV
ncbi:hypothetical protein CSKR_101167, partial [Clonorchis sinensis]